MENEFSRTELLIGEEATNKLTRCKVAVFGIGGVGSYVVEALARCGIGHFILVDNDLICLTNINRQIHATHSSVGQPKVEVMKRRVLDINPRARVEAHQIFYSGKCGTHLVSLDLDYIIDAIDSVKSKIELIVNATRLNIPIISSMGAGNKLDPGCFEIADIYHTSVCPLARVMRRELRRRDIPSLKVVYSKETPVIPGSGEELAYLEDCPDRAAGEGVPSSKRHPGSIAFVPSTAGLLIASQVVKDLLST